MSYIVNNRFARPGEMIGWVEPIDADGMSMYCSMHYEDVVKLRCSELNKTFYLSDQEAVDDFMVVHWAWVIVEGNDPNVAFESGAHEHPST